MENFKSEPDADDVNGAGGDASVPEAHDRRGGRNSVALPPETEEYLRQVQAEVNALGEGSHLVKALAERELARVRAGEITEQGYIIVHRDVPVKIVKKVLIPLKEHPKINFVGRLLGPKGNTLKALQATTRTRIMIFGRGSMWDKAKEEEMRNSGEPKYSHLNEDLHIYIEIHAYPVEAQGRFAHVLNELKKFLDPNLPGYIPSEFEEQRGPAHMPPMRPMRPPPPGMRGPPPPHMRPRPPPPGGPRGFGPGGPPRPRPPVQQPQPVAAPNEYYGYEQQAQAPAPVQAYQQMPVRPQQPMKPKAEDLSYFSPNIKPKAEELSYFSLRNDNGAAGQEYDQSQALGYAQYPSQNDYSNTGYETADASQGAGSYGQQAATQYGAVAPNYGQQQSAQAAYTGYESSWGETPGANGQIGGKAPQARFAAPKKPRPSPYAQQGGYQ